MQVPKKRVSRSQRDQRRSHDALVLNAAIEACPDCGASKLRHHVCKECGSYRGRKIFSDNDTPAAAE